MALSKILKSLVTPHAIIFYSVLLSFFAWLLPDFGILRKGFSAQLSMFSIGFFTAILWYTLAFLLAFISYNLGLKIKLSPIIFEKYIPLERKRPYIILTLFALTGCAATYIIILSNIGFNNAINFLSTGQANQLKYVLYEDYSAGILSLRYLAIQSCALAIFRRLRLKLKSKLDIVNILLLLSIVIVSSRLALVMMVFLCSFLFIVHSERIKVNPIKLLALGFILFLTLSALSYSRNKGFYEAKGYGFWSAGISEIVTYLGTPFQGAVAVGNNPSLIIQQPDNWTAYAYIEKSLSTNSAFLQLFKTYGWLSFLIMGITIVAFSFLVGLLKKQRNNYLFLSVLTILYAFAEFWRLYWFGSGIMITLVSFPLVLTVITIFLSKSAWKSMISQ